MVRRSSELLGGNVALDPAVGSGSRSTVEVPRALGSRFVGVLKGVIR
jgi:hypothetical protein